MIVREVFGQREKVVLSVVGVEEWVLRVVQAMYSNASQVTINVILSEEFVVKVGVH